MSNFEPIMTADHSDLGKKSSYDPYYNPDKLFPIARKINRDKIGVAAKLPFYGFDIWNHYEVSWLTKKGKPMAAIAEIIYSSDSPNIIESKSMKLYFNSFNNTKIENVEDLQSIIKNDLELRVGSPVSIRIAPLNSVDNGIFYRGFEAICIDEIDVECSDYNINTSYLSAGSETVEEILYSDLLKSNCMVTNQPDWGSIQIAYQGQKIDREGLLRYIISFRNCNDFSEQCIERIFIDIMQYCKPTKLSVYGRFTRRGGLDINPYRSTEKINHDKINKRLCRQ